MPENSDKITQRIFEKVDDASQLIKEAFWDSTPIKSLCDGDTSLVAPKHSHKLLIEAHTALKHNDMEEAAHQLRREVDFCNMVPKMAGSPYAKSGNAGIKALKKHKTAAEIDQDIVEAWNKAWAENPAPFYKTD